MAKFHFIKRTVMESEVDHIIDLGRAGMACKCIAAEVYGEPTETSIRRVSHILGREEIRLTDYRMGRNQMGKAMISAIRNQVDIVNVIRAASKRITQALRKTA